MTAKDRSGVNWEYDVPVFRRGSLARATSDSESVLEKTGATNQPSKTVGSAVGGAALPVRSEVQQGGSWFRVSGVTSSGLEDTDLATL